MKVSQLIEELAKGTRRPAYLVAGAEPLLRDEALAAIEAAVLGEGEQTILADTPVSFHCPCDRSRVRVAAAALGRDEIKKLMAEEEDLSISCDYCREPYSLGVADYRQILDDLEAD